MGEELLSYQLQLIKKFNNRRLTVQTCSQYIESRMISSLKRKRRKKGASQFKEKQESLIPKKITKGQKCNYPDALHVH